MVYILAGMAVAIQLFSGCSKEKYVEPTANDQAPLLVSNVSAEPLPGAARITYSLPEDENLYYVKAVYEIRPGYQREVIASLYTDYLVVDGFPEEKEYTVHLYSVSYGEHQSATAATVSFTPKPSPLQEAYESFKFEETFGGIALAFDNSSESSLAVAILTPDSAGRLSEVETYYSKARTGRHAVRGFESSPRLFAAVIRDRWGNLSDTIQQTLTPIFEELIPKDRFKGIFLPTDTYEPHPQANHTVDKLWDGIIGPNGGVAVFHTKPGSGMPQWFTFDMGQAAILSRFKLFHRGPGSQWSYQQGDPKRFEVWGSLEAPDPTGSWEGWTKIMDCNSYKPSGEGNPVSNEDMIYATTTGEDYIFPDNPMPIRYLRFKILETWGFVDYMYITELTFWGQLQ
ncbi:DUF5000 domain-containing lipoprotein [Niabella terrae]